MRANSPVRASARVVAPLLIVMAAVLQVGCNAFKPTEVENPNVTDKQFVGSPGSGAAWLLGVERQFLVTLNNVVINSELVSDNYFNDYTTNSQKMDVPDLEYIDPDITDIQSDIARLRNVATFGLDTVFPQDTSVTPEDRAEALFYRGMANLVAGEMFVALPATAKGEVVSWQDLLQLAISDFSEARSTATDAAMTQGCTLALARAYYRLGNKAKAVEEATALLAADPTFIRNAEFDPVQGPANRMQGVLTSSVNNLQPLPRLDFLDPKYPNRGPNDQSPIAYLKAEEAHLILAEASLSDEDVDGAKSQLTQLLSLVLSRGTELVNSELQKRGRAGGKIVYPNTADTKVAFAPGEPLRTGYVLTRSEGDVAVPTISGTSVTQADVDGIESVDDGLYLVYLMRQEIFIGEGRRMADLGIRMPVAQTEILANPNAQEGADYTTAQIPSFVPTGFGLDAFQYDSVAKTAVISFDMNRVLVDNKTSPAVLPFN